MCAIEIGSEKERITKQTLTEIRLIWGAEQKRIFEMYKKQEIRNRPRANEQWSTVANWIRHIQMKIFISFCVCTSFFF